MKRFYRSREERVIAGIAGGIGEILDIDPVIIRLGAVFAAIATAVAPVVITYIVGWIIIPEKPYSLPTGEAETEVEAEARQVS